EVELEVGRGIERGGELREIVIEEAGVEALDGDAVLEVLLEGALVGGLEGADALLHNIPAEDFLVDISKLDTAGELREVGILLDQGLRVEDDGGVEVLLRN